MARMRHAHGIDKRRRASVTTGALTQPSERTKREERMAWQPAPEGYVYCTECLALVKIRAMDGKPRAHTIGQSRGAGAMPCPGGSLTPSLKRTPGMSVDYEEGDLICTVIMPSGRPCNETYRTERGLNSHQRRSH